MTWYVDRGPESDVVLSSRVRIARNVCDCPFPNRMDAKTADAVSHRIQEAFMERGGSASDGYVDVDLDGLSEQDRLALAEKRLISDELARSGGPRRALISQDESITIMVNEEDHIRVQGIASGLDLNEAYRKAEAVAMLLEEQLPMAYSEKLGFLTACPTNTGTGMRASVMAHLPGLTMTSRIQGTMEGLGKMGFAVRGNRGEHSFASGNLFQISNQITLGLSEDEIITDLQRIVGQLIEQERKARQQVFQADPLRVKDQARRSLGLLRYAGRITTEEAMRRISELRLGIALDVIPDIDEETVNRIMVAIGPASIQKKAGKPLDESERDAVRAETIQSIIG